MSRGTDRPHQISALLHRRREPLGGTQPPRTRAPEGHSRSRRGPPAAAPPVPRGPGPIPQGLRHRGTSPPSPQCRQRSVSPVSSLARPWLGTLISWGIAPWHAWLGFSPTSGCRESPRPRTPAMLLLGEQHDAVRVMDDERGPRRRRNRRGRAPHSYPRKRERLLIPDESGRLRAALVWGENCGGLNRRLRRVW